jgi:hypothetical protein
MFNLVDMKLILLINLILTTSISYGQQTDFIGTTFCGRTSSEHEGRISCSTHELRNCDLSIIPADTSLHVVAFSLTIVPLNNVGKPAEYRINADRIPYDYVEQLCSAKAFRLENISLVDSSNNVKAVKPIVITVLP